MQGAHQQCTEGQLEAVLAGVTSCAAFGSIVVGTIAGVSRAVCENVLAANGLLCTVVDVRSEMESLGRSEEAPVNAEDAQQWLFTSQHQRLSATEMVVFDDHVAAAEEVDEDFFGNFS